MNNTAQTQNPMTAAAAMPKAAAEAAQANQQNAPQAVIGLFSSITSAESAVNQLRSSGFSTEEINIVSKIENNMASADDSIADGAMTGGALGTIGGLMLSAGALAIPGVGPIVAAGPIAAALSGAVSGGIAGGLIDWGIPADKSDAISNEISAGSTLAVIKTDSSKVSQAVQILTANGAANVETHMIK